MITRASDLARRVRARLEVSVGNQMDISAVDVLEWLLDSESAKTAETACCGAPTLYDLDSQKIYIDVFALYVEGLNPGDGARLLRLLARIRTRGSLLVVYKAGRSLEGAEAAAGHTASLAGSFQLFRQLLEPSGAILC